MTQIQGLIVAYVTEGSVNRFTIVCHGEAKDSAKQATAHTDKLLGVSTRLPKEPGEHIDVVRSGITPVVYGDTVKRGDFVTADSQGRAVKATSGQAYIGIAEEDGVEDDLGSIFVTNGVFTG
ncbi:TPA: DUF2190 family protein [Pasteurella multocida]|uniref:capsid cement protein n=1 Tax=Pasteurella multocida TaxID=747 RepID=UPI002020B022|nr:capsid cement protein [Pasteurella multocida]MCL7841665.1 DUF2190 family protein [Pasteurella multocida]HDR1157425.1 DUF2190 family protein [Pasteurella multocida]HDR1505005.1 DUF2190 family protein [Pasteurella multocida]HDR1586396.1 DUF2190 family protein [Pasteurella multocida]HDR1875374.1 DUF2190 family protein [Pasteurella multocida]